MKLTIEKLLTLLPVYEDPIIDPITEEIIEEHVGDSEHNG